MVLPKEKRKNGSAAAATAWQLDSCVCVWGGGSGDKREKKIWKKKDDKRNTLKASNEKKHGKQQGTKTAWNASLYSCFFFTCTKTKRKYNSLKWNEKRIKTSFSLTAPLLRRLYVGWVLWASPGIITHHPVLCKPGRKKWLGCCFFFSQQKNHKCGARTAAGSCYDQN